MVKPEYKVRDISLHTLKFAIIRNYFQRSEFPVLPCPLRPPSEASEAPRLGYDIPLLLACIFLSCLSLQRNQSDDTLFSAVNILCC